MVVTCAPSDDADAVAQALAREPNVVIFERGEPDMAVEILRYAPEALLIDVTMAPGPAFTWHREEIQSRPDGIVGAIRGVRHPIDRSPAPARAVPPPRPRSPRASAPSEGSDRLLTRRTRLAGRPPARLDSRCRPPLRRDRRCGVTDRDRGPREGMDARHGARVALYRISTARRMGTAALGPPPSSAGALASVPPSPSGGAEASPPGHANSCRIEPSQVSHADDKNPQDPE